MAFKRIDGLRTIEFGNVGASRDLILHYLFQGNKRATAGLLDDDYEAEGEPIEHVGEELVVVGNLGGLFFPGLVGVFLGVLPYAFKPIASRSWFLWMILLFIAAIMIWIAVRLEQMRKVGKSSISWVKALK